MRSAAIFFSDAFALDFALVHSPPPNLERVRVPSSACDPMYFERRSSCSAGRKSLSEPAYLTVI